MFPDGHTRGLVGGGAGAGAGYPGCGQGLLETTKLFGNVDAVQVLTECHFNSPEHRGDIYVRHTPYSPDGVGVWSSWKKIGSPQRTYRNVTASRALNVTYTNTTGVEMSVIINSTGAVNSWATIVVDGLLIAEQATHTSAGSVTYGTFSAEVPAGSTYSVASNAGVQSWIELSV